MAQDDGIARDVTLPVRGGESMEAFVRRMLMAAAADSQLPASEHAPFADLTMRAMPGLTNRTWDRDPTPSDRTDAMQTSDFDFLLLQVYLRQNPGAGRRGRRPISVEQVRALDGSRSILCRLGDETVEALRAWRVRFVQRGGTLGSGQDATYPPLAFDEREASARQIIQMLGIVGRGTWGARAAGAVMEPDWNYRAIAVHHSGYSGLNNMRSVQDEHLKKYADIGYHYGIASSGEIYEGRELMFKGSHVGVNTANIGIVCLGTFGSGLVNLPLRGSYGGDPIQPAMIAALRRLVVHLRSVFAIGTFGGHVEYTNVDSCPGSELLPVVQQLRRDWGLAAPVSTTIRR